MTVGPILIVDDDPRNLAAMRQILGADYRLTFARDGAGAIAAAHKHQPTLILLDVMMPDMDGYQVCRVLKSDPRTEPIPVIFITGLADVGNESKGFNVGGVDYITKPVSPPVVRARVRTHCSLIGVTQLERSYRDAISMLGEAGHYNDNDTGVHIWRMAAYARTLAAAIGWSKIECDLIEQAAPMHDTGKVGIPDSILRKPARLTPDEWVVMKTHTVIGHEILRKSDAPVFRLAAEIALNHHERWDGGGYPAQRAGTAIPESARIVAIADVFDALTMKRPYKDAWPIDRVLATIREGAGNHFDPALTDTFFDIVPDILDIREQWLQGD